MDDKFKKELDAAIDAAVKEAKEDNEKVEKVVKRSIAWAPPHVIHHREGTESFSYCRLIKAMATSDWSDAGFEKEAIQKTAGTFPEAGLYGPDSTTTAGGYLIPPEYSRELIDLLAAKAVVRQAGARVYPMASSIMYIPSLTAGATVSWGPSTEGTALTGDATTAVGQVTLTAKDAYCFVGISNQLLNDSSPAVETIVRSDIVRELALAEDKAFLVGGAATMPTGLLDNWSQDYAKVNVTNSLIKTNYLYAGGNGTTAASGGGVITYDDIMDAMYEVELYNAKVSGFIMHPRTKNSLRKIQDANGQYIYAIHPEQKVPDTLYGLPVYLTTQVTIDEDDNNNSGVSNLSWVLLGDWSEYIIGQRQDIELAVSEHVGFYSNTTWIRANMRVAGNVKHEKAFCAILDVAA